MRKLHLLMACCLLALLLSACQTLPSSSLEQQTLNTTSSAATHSKVDSRKVALIDRNNRVRGVDTLWINPPQKRTKKDDSE